MNVFPQPKQNQLILVAFSTMLLAACGGGGSTDVGGVSADRLKTPVAGQTLNERECGYQYTLQNIPVGIGADPLLSDEWYLRNLGGTIAGVAATAGEDLRVLPVWATNNKGEGVRVAVVDDAIEITHPDISPNVVTNGSFNYRPSSPFAYYPLPCFNGSNKTVNDDHGTAVTGIIAARDGNGIGTAGVAPRAQLVGYNALSTGTDADIADALTRDLASNAIVHNSWGSSDDGKLHTADSLFVASINKGITTGRDGKGSIYVFPAGNGGCYAQNSDASCRYSENSNFDGYVNKLGQITVCGVGFNGISPYYAEPGANILVCAPASRISTTDVQAAWRPDFSGTSAAAPMVSGVIALMLNANPNLTWRDVKLILARSARKNHVQDPEWVSALGYNFNPFYGFGVADATAAVALSKTWTSVGNSSTLKSCGPYARTINLVLPDAPANNRERTDSIQVGSNCTISRIEFIEVTFSAAHAYSGDLSVSLVSPNGLVSKLADPRSCGPDADACRPYLDWQFGSVRHLDEPSNGIWTLKVSDNVPVDTGSWTNWSVKFYGR
jgi:proprotein convertase subtilisin/kexin type 2